MEMVWYTHIRKTKRLIDLNWICLTNAFWKKKLKKPYRRHNDYIWEGDDEDEDSDHHSAKSDSEKDDDSDKDDEEDKDSEEEEEEEEEQEEQEEQEEEEEEKEEEEEDSDDPEVIIEEQPKMRVRDFLFNLLWTYSFN